ncbi:DUF748 domain-containing protein [Marinobacter sp. CHS3-4]|uniref:DUF748 domain-containing protein n=1 Tax=Marinobacter sp. CHS3-4 TaxID=3045174 RepID=UPI0024B4CED0|nr:DUF748 domain-containing protein [Marinobacter sp. CHS3-4]MDI9243662.1 DUF748 domain-containing protein [Marinobacter sp. CHS3-4]
MVRKLSIGVVILVALYALAGFVVLPWWLERTIPERLAQHMGWEGSVEDVKVNPFAMSIEALGLTARDGDGEPVLSFDRLYVNLGVLRLATGVIALQDLELASPFARLDLRDDYSVNFARDWQANNPATDEVPEAEPGSEAAEPSKLVLDRIRIIGGEVLFRDFSRPDAEEFQIAPLDLALNDLATWPREGSQSDYSLQAAIGNQTVEWDGNLTIAPFASDGYLRISDISYTTLAHFLGPFLPYSLRDGNLSVSSSYEMRSGEQFALSTSDGEVTMTGLALAETADSETDLLKVARVHLPAVMFDLIGRELSVGRVALDDFQMELERDPQGSLNVVRPLGTAEPADTEGADTTDDGAPDPTQQSPFRWSVAGVELKNGSVNWLDNQPSTSANLSLQQLNLTLGRLSDQLAEPVDYEADMRLANGGRMSFRGQTTPQPFTLEAGISLNDLNLAQIDPYLGDITNLTLRDGLLTVDGNLNLDNQESPLTGTFSGTAQVASLDLGMTDSGGPLLAWRNMRLEPLEYNIAPARLEIGTLTLSNPNINVVREQSGQHNFARILPESASNADVTEPTQVEVQTEEGLIFRIGQILLEDGEVSYANRTLNPVFSTRLDRLNGSVSGLSNVSPQQGKVAIQGRVGDVASLKFDGSIGTLGTEDVSDLKLIVDDISLPALSPYLGQYLGYAIESGKLDLDLNYKLAGSRIDADNHILLDRMELGDTVDSEQAVNAPVKLGLALLRDTRGLIDIDLPIEGDLDDPQFRIGPVVMRTFVNLIAKAATSPFSMLGSLAEMTGLTGEELGYVSFQPGRAKLAPGDLEKLEVLSDALAERPSLLLKVRGAVSPETDGGFLRRQALAEQLSISELPSAADRIARLESRYQAAGFEQSLAAYREEVAGSANMEPDEQAWEAALVNRLLSTVELRPERLADLARERGVVLSTTLQEEFDVSDDQLFLLEPLQDAEQDEAGQVKVNFELEAR